MDDERVTAEWDKLGTHDSNIKHPIQSKTKTKQLFIEGDSRCQDETNKKKKQSISCKVIMCGPVTLDTHDKQ